MCSDPDLLRLYELRRGSADVPRSLRGYLAAWCSCPPAAGTLNELAQVPPAPVHPPTRHPPVSRTTSPRPARCQSAQQSLWPRLKTPLCTQAGGGGSRAAAGRGRGGGEERTAGRRDGALRTGSVDWHHG